MPGRKISTALLAWFDLYGRKDLPWQFDRTPYRVWVSEIMLQQTQVSTVIPYYQRFMQRFPTVDVLATADADEVMHLWTGLGYYSRARNLLRTAQIIVQEHSGAFPDSLEGLQQLPGIGRSTAGAILALAFNKKAPILDGNVKRVLARYCAIIEWPGNKETTAQLWDIAEAMTPAKRTADYTQAIMDLGATVCTRKPSCSHCPLRRNCVAHRQGIAAMLPTSRPRHAPLPVKASTLLIIRSGNHILLQKRPPKGIWSNLWSLPELADCVSTAAATQHCKTHLQITPRRPKNAASLPAFRHTFTHFHLDIHPLILESGKARELDSRREIWYNLQQPQTIGLPAPVKKLLDHLPCQP